MKLRASLEDDARRFVDNNGFHIARPMIHAEGSDIDGFAYALRAPR